MTPRSRILQVSYFAGIDMKEVFDKTLDTGICPPQKKGTRPWAQVSSGVDIRGGFGKIIVDMDLIERGHQNNSTVDLNH